MSFGAVLIKSRANFDVHTGPTDEDFRHDVMLGNNVAYLLLPW